MIVSTTTFLIGKNSETPSAVGKKGTKRGKKEEGKKMKKVRIVEREGSDSDSDSESESGRVAESAEETSKKRKKKEKVKKLSGFEVVPVEDNGKAKTASVNVRLYCEQAHLLEVSGRMARGRLDSVIPIMTYTNRTQTLLFPCLRNINF